MNNYNTVVHTNELVIEQHQQYDTQFRISWFKNGYFQKEYFLNIATDTNVINVPLSDLYLAGSAVNVEIWMDYQQRYIVFDYFESANRVWSKTFRLPTLYS